MFQIHFFLFQSDFSGRVVNNDHFLYWGDVIKTNEEGTEFHIQVWRKDYSHLHNVLIGVLLYNLELLLQNL